MDQSEQESSWGAQERGRCPAAAAGPSGGRQVPLPGVLAAADLPALRNPPRSREATFIYAAEGCLTQGAFSRGGQRPSERSGGRTSGRALKNPEARLRFSSSQGFAAGPHDQQQQGGMQGAGKGRRVLGRLLGTLNGCGTHREGAGMLGIPSQRR